MRRFLLLTACLALFLTSSTTFAQLYTPKTEGKLEAIAPPIPGPAPIIETWEAAFLYDAEQKPQKVGHVHFVVIAKKVDGKTIYETRRTLELELTRGNQKATLKAITGTDEQADGLVTGVHMTQYLGAQQSHIINGTLVEQDNKQTMRIVKKGDTNSERELEWSPKIVGLYRETRLLAEQKLKVGDSFEYVSYEPTINHFATTTLKGLGTQRLRMPDGKIRETLKFEAKPAKIQNLQLPSQILWVDPTTYEVIQSASEIPGLGPLTMVRCSRQEAMSANGQVGDILKEQSIKLAHPVDGLHQKSKVTYRITFTGDVDAAELLQSDERQSVKIIDRKTLEVTITARRAPVKVEIPLKQHDDDLASNFFINSADKKVQELATQAVGDTSDRWMKARKIEAWVRANMKAVDYTSAMETADHVAKTLKGDCTEYAMLAAAMCRAEKVPSRTALGLIYVNTPNGAVMAFHMWLEVMIDGQWLALDPTMGVGSVGPGHITITRSNWAGEQSLKPLIPVTSFMMGKPKVEVIE